MSQSLRAGATRLMVGAAAVVGVILMSAGCGDDDSTGAGTGGTGAFGATGGAAAFSGGNTAAVGGVAGGGGTAAPPATGGVGGVAGAAAVGGVAGGGATAAVTGGTGGTGGAADVLDAGTAGAAGVAGTGTGGAAVIEPFDGSVGDGGGFGGAGGAGGAGGGAGGVGGTGGGGGTSDIGCEGNQVLPSVTDISQSGPFRTTTESRTGPGGSHTIFRPDPLGEGGFLHPMITFGPGMMTSGGTSYTTLLTHLATLGYVVIAVETLGGGPGAQGNTDAMVNALEWLIEQNSQAGVYQGMLAVNCGVAMGYSLGASATPFVGEHPAVVTGVAIHGHIQMQSAEPHGPVLFLTGNGPSAVGDQVSQVVAGLNSAPGLMALYEGQGHLDVIWTQLGQGQPEFTALTAWLRYWVNGDDNAKSHFWGPGCTMCSDNSWTMESNALWDALSL